MLWFWVSIIESNQTRTKFKSGGRSKFANAEFHGVSQHFKPSVASHKIVTRFLNSIASAQNIIFPSRNLRTLTTEIFMF